MNLDKRALNTQEKGSRLLQKRNYNQPDFFRKRHSSPSDILENLKD